VTLRSEIEQHLSWLHQYIAGMTDANWQDMRLRAERQLAELSDLLRVGEQLNQEER
jgi:hypothetical protein